MTIDEAIKDIKDNIKPIVGGKSLDMAIEALERQRWTPCSKQLPKKSGYYLATIDRGLKVVDVIFFLNGSGFLMADTVTAWKPRPEPYQKGGEQNDS